MDNIPVIRMEFERMKHSIMAAVSKQQLEFDDMFHRALDSACDPKRIQAMLDVEVRRCLDGALKRETADYFAYGNGRTTIRDAVKQRLDKDWEMVDEVVDK
jgi:DNA-binding GntR family transcriptional regulator